MLDLERHGAAEMLCAGHPFRNLLGDRREALEHGVGIGEVVIEGALGADRLERPVGLHLALVQPAGDAEIVAPDLAEAAGKLVLGAGAQLGAVVNAKRLHLARGRRADAVEALDRQAGDEGLGLLGPDHREAVRLLQVRCDLRQELVERDAGRGGEARWWRGSPA